MPVLPGLEIGELQDEWWDLSKLLMRFVLMAEENKSMELNYVEVVRARAFDDVLVKVRNRKLTR